jgi:hypothetical protein
MEIVFYILIKYTAYTLWSFAGIKSIFHREGNLLAKSAAFGAVRLVMGIFFGILIFVAALSMNNATRNSMLTYAVIYVPVRVLEWSILAMLMKRGPATPSWVWWISGGVLISCLADLPLAAISGDHIVPVGRPFC